MKVQFSKILLVAVLFTAVPVGAASERGVAARLQSAYNQTELYFGRAKRSGGTVTDAEWDRFLAEVVTPRFPDGFTILKADGQYRQRNGVIVTEPSEVLVFLYPAKNRVADGRRISEIRRLYIKRFDQESVLRVDSPQPVRVWF